MRRRQYAYAASRHHNATVDVYNCTTGHDNAGVHVTVDLPDGVHDYLPSSTRRPAVK